MAWPFQQPQQQSVFVKYSRKQSPHISIQGGGYRYSGETSQSNPLEQDKLLDLIPVTASIVSHVCSCVRTENTSGGTRSSQETRQGKLSDKFLHLFDDDDDDSENFVRYNCEENESQDNEGSELDDLLITLKKFSSRTLNPLQARSIARLAKSYSTVEKLTVRHAETFRHLFDLDSPPLQDAALIVLTKILRKENNLHFIFTESPAILDSVLSFASDPKTVEVQISALMVIQQVSFHTKWASQWERQLENIVYPLVHAIIKNRESSQGQKEASLGVLRNLSHLPAFAAQVKQDILSKLDVVWDSSKMKALYLEILCENLQKSKQRVSTDVLDNVLLPVLGSMMQEGPCKSQEQALLLLECVCEDEASRHTVLVSTHCVVLTVLCVKHSQCRRVRKSSLGVLIQLLGVKKQKEAKLMMEGVAEALKLEGNRASSISPMSRPDQLTSLLRLKSRKETQLWRQWEKFLHQLNLLVESEGDLSKDAKTLRFVCDLNVIGRLNSNHVTCLSNAISCFINLCAWPRTRPRQTSGDMGDATEFLSLDGFKLRCGPLNHHNTMDIWHHSGSQMMSLLLHILRRLPQASPVMTDNTRTTDGNHNSEPNGVDKGTFIKNHILDNSSSIVVKSVLQEEEITLIKDLLEYILTMCVATCCLSKQDMEGQPVSSKATEESVEKRMKEELSEKEKSAERRILRRDLVEEGIFYITSQLINVESDMIKVLCVTILRLCLQPVNGKAQLTKARKDIQFVPWQGHKLRPQSAVSAPGQWSKQTILQTQFQLGKPGMGERPESPLSYRTSRQRPFSAQASGNTHHLIRDSCPTSAKYSLFSPLTLHSVKKPIFSRNGSMASQDDNRPSYDFKKGIINYGNPQRRDRRPHSAQSRVSSGSKPKSATWTEPSLDFLLSPLEPGPDLGQQCLDRATLASRGIALKGIFSPDAHVKKSCLMFIHDLVLYSEKYLHMELAKRGYISKLVDFLRINDDNELLEITGLIITRMMISSDRRICQLFNRHGGASLLMALLQKHSGGDLRKALGSTLNTVNTVMHAEPKATSDCIDKQRPADVWEHIMHRWEGEDEVVSLLQQFL